MFSKLTFVSRWAAVQVGCAALTLALAGAEPIEQVQRASVEWARVRDETARLQAEWIAQRESLEAVLAALKSRRKELAVHRDSLQAAVDQDSLQFATTERRANEARQHLGQVAARLAELVAVLQATRPYLPPRVSAGLELPFRSISDPKLGPAERMQHVMTILNRCAAFNAALTVTEEELALEHDGAARLLEVVYVGLSHGYALDRAHERAYLGRPSSTGWTWIAQHDATTAVARIIDVHREQSDPVFEFLPVQIADPLETSEVSR